VGRVLLMGSRPCELLVFPSGTASEEDADKRDYDLAKYIRYIQNDISNEDAQVSERWLGREECDILHWLLRS
jgi:hypothetical protein